MRVTYYPAAEGELIEIARFYERRVTNLGAEFLKAIDQAVAAIAQDPKRWRIVDSDVRRYLMRRFPFAIYYRTLTDQLRILAIKHHSRHPNYGRGRR